MYVKYLYYTFRFYSDIPNKENITLHFWVNDISGYYISRRFNISSDKVYKIPFVAYNYHIFMDIAITYPDIPLSGSVYICEIEVKGK